MADLRRLLAQALGYSHGGSRNLWDSFGYPKEVTTQLLFEMYIRDGVSSRIIRAFPEATWSDDYIFSDENGNSPEESSDSYSPFSSSVHSLFSRFKVDSFMSRADRLASIGRFGVLLMGFEGDTSDLEQPQEGKQKLSYLAAYGEPFVRVNRMVADPGDTRYGLPESYSIDIGSTSSIVGTGGGGSSASKTVTVHHSRVIHIAEFLDQNEVYGTPRLLPVFNHLLDLQKVLGSGSETFWLNARGGLSVSADKDAELNETSIADMKNQLDEYEHNLRRALTMQGVTTKMLTTSIADPSPIVERLLDLIAGGVGMPKRILIGSERGELGSSQDESNWASRIDERQNSFASPFVLKPFIQRMIETGNVEQPVGEWDADWPESPPMSPQQQAERATKIATSISTYAAQPNSEMVVPIQEFRESVLGLPPEPDENYIDDELEDLDEEDEEVQEQFEENKKLAANAKPRSLYVRRNVLNANEIRDHFAAQGLKVMTPADEMHVTIAFSRSPVDWMEVEPAWNQEPDGGLSVPPGGARLMELFGKEYPPRVLVQLFSSAQLSWRHVDMTNAGCSWDFPSYEPHITITYDLGLSVSKESEWKKFVAGLEPWTGPIELGPEVFEEIVDSWKDGVVENRRSA